MSVHLGGLAGNWVARVAAEPARAAGAFAVFARDAVRVATEAGGEVHGPPGGEAYARRALAAGCSAETAFAPGGSAELAGLAELVWPAPGAFAVRPVPDGTGAAAGSG